MAENIQKEDNRFRKSNNSLKNSSQLKEQGNITETTSPATSTSESTEEENKKDVKAILNNIGKKKKPKASSHTIYLDDDIFEKIQQKAKKSKMSISSFINAFFKEAFEMPEENK